MRAGQLRQVVKIQSRSTALGDRGQPVDTWAVIATVFANVETLSGGEALNARQLYASAQLRVTIRHWPGLTPQHRLLFGARVLEIGHVDDFEQRGVTHVLLCSESLSP